MGTTLQKYAPVVLSVTRMVVGLFFMMHGLMIFGWIHPPVVPGMPAHGPAAGGSGLDLHLLAAFLEVFGGALFILGLFTRPAAFILSGEMAVAYFMVHAPKNIWPLFNDGDAAVLYCWIFFLYVFLGPGPISLDYLIFKRA